MKFLTASLFAVILASATVTTKRDRTRVGLKPRSEAGPEAIEDIDAQLSNEDQMETAEGTYSSYRTRVRTPE